MRKLDWHFALELALIGGLAVTAFFLEGVASAQEVELAPDLEAAISQAAAEPVPPRVPLKDFAALPEYQDVILSPNGQYLAFLMPVRGRLHAVIQPVKPKGDDIQILPPIKDFDIYDIRWANGERLLVSYETSARSIEYRNRRTETRMLIFGPGMEKMENLIRYKSEGVTRYTPQGQIQTDVVDILYDDPDHILMALDPKRDLVYDVVKIDIHTRTQRVVQRGRAGTQEWLTDQQGVPRLGYGYRLNDFYVHYRNPDTNSWMRLDKTEWHDQGFYPVAFMEDPRYAYALGHVDGREALVRLNIVEGKVEEVLFAHDKIDVGGIVRDESGRRVVGVRYTEHYAQTHYFDDWYAKLQATVDRLLPETANYIVNARAAKKLYLILATSDRIEGDYYVLDLNSKQLYFLVSQRPKIDPKQMAHVTPVSYRARDGLEIPAYLTLPNGRAGRNMPTILLPHGGPWSRDTQSFDYWAQFLANRGYAVFQPNFRGSTGYGVEFYELGKKQWGGTMQDDLTDAAHWLIEQGIADPKRICIVGWSYGGYAALMGAVKTPDLFTCAGSVNGVADLPDLFARDRSFVGADEWRDAMTLEGEGRRAASPQRQADEIKIPVFLAAAKDDVRVPYSQSRSLYNKIKDRVPAVYLELENGNHGLDHEDARLAMMRGLESFLGQHLGPGAPPVAGGSGNITK